MELTNFELAYPQGVELVGLGHNWDLHNFATCVGASYDAGAEVAIVSWVRDTPDNPWGDPSNLATGCTLRFEGVTRWIVEPGAGPDGDTLAEISSIPQDEADWDELDEFDLWLRFEDGTMIKIAAQSGTLVSCGTGEPN